MSQQDHCQGKSRIATYSQAAKVAKRMNRKYEGRLEPYKCRGGNHYHVGSHR
jgi:hypothetical protein